MVSTNIKNEILISICIATFNRASKLKDIILLLESQNFDRGNYEIIVTDSFSNDNTKTIMEELIKQYDNIIYKEDCKNILANKRNEGIKLSNSEIIVFLDDDVYPTNEFVRAHYEANIKNYDTFYCGQIRFDSELVNKSNYFKFRDDQHLKDNCIGKDLPFNKIVVMNLSFKKSFINKVGYVDERFINYGCEDTEFGYRVVNSGYKLRYLRDALAIHREDSRDIVEYSKKIAKNAMCGKKIINKINPNVLNTLVQIKFDNKNVINFILFNDLFGKIVEFYLLISDKISFLYNYYLFKYYLYYINYKYI